MTTLSDETLLKYTSRANEKVVLLTGAASGIGKETAILFARHGAKVVIGDIDISGANAVVDHILQFGGHAVAQLCDVVSWKDQVALFELAVRRFGGVDILISAAGIMEQGRVCAGTLDIQKDGPNPPNLNTLNVNLIGVIYSTHLGMHYLKQSDQPHRGSESCKAIVFVGSMASMQSIPLAPIYSASKHALMGFMRSLYLIAKANDIRLGLVGPFFADTKILNTTIRLLLTGIPLTPVPRIASAILFAALDPDLETSACAWMLPDEGPVLRLDRKTLSSGAYGLINARIESLIQVRKSTRYLFAAAKHSVALIRKTIFPLSIMLALGFIAHNKLTTHPLP